MCRLGIPADLGNATLRFAIGFKMGQICAGVFYLVEPDSMLAFGEPSNTYRISFEEAEASSTALFESLMMGMAAGANDEVMQQVKDSLEK